MEPWSHHFLWGGGGCWARYFRRGHYFWDLLSATIFDVTFRGWGLLFQVGYGFCHRHNICGAISIQIASVLLFLYRCIYILFLYGRVYIVCIFWTSTHQYNTEDTLFLLNCYLMQLLQPYYVISIVFQI